LKKWSDPSQSAKKEHFVQISGMACHKPVYGRLALFFIAPITYKFDNGAMPAMVCAARHQEAIKHR